ncbi:hypothetical protein CEXT_270741 [Caerostris extrusa]|uniref:Uncharacterized protein n=1 Tax=Caerostris extrusa TaxID=172846 RepID=A0AAV4VUA0_CAEEX|nr:hypothetical protein CEXT_270741 [Caerostris extrusa]
MSGKIGLDHLDDETVVSFRERYNSTEAAAKGHQPYIASSRCLRPNRTPIAVRAALERDNDEKKPHKKIRREDL